MRTARADQLVTGASERKQNITTEGTPHRVQGVPCPRGLGFVDLDLGCSTTLLGQ